MKRTILAAVGAFSVACAGGVPLLIQGGKSDRAACLGAKPGQDLAAAMADAGLPTAVSTDGGVCKIGDTGCDASRCFCECGLTGCRYWALFTRKPGDADWRYARAGATKIHPADFAAIAWVWAEGDMRRVSAKPAGDAWKTACADR